MRGASGFAVVDGVRVAESTSIDGYDRRTGRPLVGSREAVGELSDRELEAEITIAAGAARRRAKRLGTLLSERAKRRKRPTSTI
jgi:hypothetical protein